VLYWSIRLYCLGGAGFHFADSRWLWCGSASGAWDCNDAIISRALRCNTRYVSSLRFGDWQWVAWVLRFLCVIGFGSILFWHYLSAPKTLLFPCYLILDWPHWLLMRWVFGRWILEVVYYGELWSVQRAIIVARSWWLWQRVELNIGPYFYIFTLILGLKPWGCAIGKPFVGFPVLVCWLCATGCTVKMVWPSIAKTWMWCKSWRLCDGQSFAACVFYVATKNDAGLYVRRVELASLVLWAHLNSFRFISLARWSGVSGEKKHRRFCRSLVRFIFSACVAWRHSVVVRRRVLGLILYAFSEEAVSGFSIGITLGTFWWRWVVCIWWSVSNALGKFIIFDTFSALRLFAFYTLLVIGFEIAV